MRRLSETAKTWLMVIPVAIAAAYVGRRAAELHNQEIENWMAIEAINWHAQELKQWQMERQMERKSNRANTVRGDAVGSKDGI
ncbi:unnamed protein product [Camellia sinensis]